MTVKGLKIRGSPRLQDVPRKFTKSSGGIYRKRQGEVERICLEKRDAAGKFEWMLKLESAEFFLFFFFR